MAPSGRGVARIPVRISPAAWIEEVERFDSRSPARIAAERERRSLEEVGLRIVDLQRCVAEAPDRMKLGGHVKVYVPISADPASQRPFGFVFSPGRDHRGVYLTFVSFGERHPRPGTRSVYERAHKRLNGRYPDQ